ncbi:MAG: hypothetical protein AB7I25_09575 [Vicinamibacterales bacterium]
MPNVHVPAACVRICAWCGLTLGAARSARDAWERGAHDLDAGAHTHTICDACLVTFFADEAGPGGEPDGLQPVAVRRRS